MLRLRATLSRFINYTPLRSLMQRLLGYSKTVEMLTHPHAVAGLESIETSIPAHDISIRDPHVLALLAHSPHYGSGVYRQRQVFAARLRGARVHFPSGAVLTRDNTVIVESALDSYRLKQTGIFGARRTPPVRLPGTMTTIWYRLSEGYYHWLLDSLTRLAALPSDTPLTLLLPNPATPLQEASLRLFLPESVTVMRVDPGVYEPDLLLMPSFLINKNSAWLPPTLAKPLRERVFSRLELTPDVPGTRRLYISRGDAPKRRLLNEAEIIAYLSARGFEIVLGSTLSFEDQVRLFHDADIVVGAHGAGLSNLLFASPQTRVLELFGTDYSLTWYSLLAHSLGQKYRFAISDSPVGRHDDFIVGLEAVRAVFDGEGW